MSVCVIWSARTRWPGSSPRGWWAHASSRSRPAGRILPSSPREGRLTEPPVELSDLMKKTGASLQKLDELARTARTGLEEINTIASSIREGKGSLGKFVRDDAAYQSLMSLTRRGEQTISAMEDNLPALKRTWPLSRYFDSRSYFEREKVLYQPGSRRDSRSFPADDLFEPKRAILTPVGRTRLDEVGRWCKQTSQPSRRSSSPPSPTTITTSTWPRS